MPTVATQTDISTVTALGFKEWCIQNRDKVDDIPPSVSTPQELWRKHRIEEEEFNLN